MKIEILLMFLLNNFNLFPEIRVISNLPRIDWVNNGSRCKVIKKFKKEKKGILKIVFTLQEYLVASFEVNKGWRKNQTQIKHFVEYMKEDSNSFGYITFSSSSNYSKKTSQKYANQLVDYLEERFGIEKNRIQILYEGERKRSVFKLYVTPERLKIPM